MKTIWILIFVLLLQCCKPASVSTDSHSSAINTNTAMLTEKYWRLTELNGQPIKTDAGNSKEPHIIFKEEEQRVTGSSGCNSFHGSYELKEGDRITLSKMASTRMACPDMEIENQFLKVLETADNYNLSEKTLVLNRARMAPLARFELVEK